MSCLLSTRPITPSSMQSVRKSRSRVLVLRRRVEIIWRIFLVTRRRATRVSRLIRMVARLLRIPALGPRCGLDRLEVACVRWKEEKDGAVLIGSVAGRVYSGAFYIAIGFRYPFLPSLSVMSKMTSLSLHANPSFALSSHANPPLAPLLLVSNNSPHLLLNRFRKALGQRLFFTRSSLNEYHIFILRYRRLVCLASSLASLKVLRPWAVQGKSL
jgi:hypothetical protein